MPGPIQVLILDDDPRHAEALIAALEAAGFVPAARRVATEAEFRAALSPEVDLVLAAEELSDWNAGAALAALRPDYPDLPVIVVGDADRELQAAELARRGVDAWIARDRPAQLGPAVAAALERRRWRGELAQAEAARRRADERRQLAEAALDATEVAVTMVNAERSITYHNQAWKALLGYTVEELEAIGGVATFRSTELADVIATEVVTTGKWTGPVDRVAKNGRVFATWLDSEAIHDAAGKLVGFLSVTTDVSDLKRAEAEIHFQTEMLDQAPAAVIGTDPAGTVTHWNRQAEALYGWTRREAIGRPITELLVPDGGQGEAERRLARLRDGGGPPAEFLARRQDGSTIPVLSSASVVRDGAGDAIGIVGVSIDLTERRALEERLRDLAYRDPLTGLPNRAAFQDDLHAALGPATAQDGPVAILILDLKRFQVVNDSLGHRAGDRLLRGVGARLRDATSPRTRLAYLGADEFAILLTGTSVERARSVASRALAALGPSFAVDDREVFLNADVGIAVADPGSADPDELLRRAHVALNEAKTTGERQVVVFDPALDARIADRLAEETALRHAVELGQFVLHYQPIVDLAAASDAESPSGHPGEPAAGRPRLRGFEALVRWLHPQRGALAPGEFLPLAEETGLIVPIGEWALAEACRRAVEWQQTRPAEPPLLAVNVSARQLRERRLGELLRHIFRETGLPPSRLTLEVTDDAFAVGGEAIAATLADLKRLGVRLALDDFGTGHSSLARLSILPLDVIKIDPTFVQRVTVDERSARMVRTMATIGHDLGLTVTAEGIESEEQARVARELGCDWGQGYLFGRPVNAGAVATMLASRAD